MIPYLTAGFVGLPIHLFYFICLLSQVLYLSVDSSLILNYNVLTTLLLGYLLYGKEKPFFTNQILSAQFLGGVPSLSSDGVLFTSSHRINAFFNEKLRTRIITEGPAFRCVRVCSTPRPPPPCNLT
jgi:hypothetical protein